MLSFKTELKKAAVVIQSHASGHGGHVSGLGISLLNHKLLEDSLNKVAENQQQASLSLLQWASEEDDHILELFTKLADLEVLHGQLYKRYSNQVESARQCYKAISKGEKHVQDLKKEYDAQQVKANKVQKQMESLRKKKEKDKVLEALDVELATAYSHESKAAEDLKIAKENHSKFKIQKVQEALRVTQKANREFHSDASELASTQDKIIKLFLGPEREEYVAKAGVLASSYITTLAEKIGLPKPLSVADKQARASFKTHQPLRTGSSSSTSSTSSVSSRHSVPVYMDHPEKEIQRPPSNRADMPLPALPLYPSLPSGNSFDNDDNGELYSEQYYSYTDVGDSHPSGILMGKHVENPPSYPPRPASSLPGSLRNRNSAPPTKHVDLTATDVQGNPLPPPPPDTSDQEYMSLVAEGIYDTAGNLQINPKQTNKNSDDEDDYMSLQGVRPNEAKMRRSIHDEDPHIYDNRLNEAAYNERI